MEENNVAVVEETTTNENTETSTVEEKVEKTFTQKEVDELITKRLDREKKKQPSPEEMKAFNDWKESQKTEADRQEEIRKENEELKSQLKMANNKTIMANYDVAPKFQELVLKEVSGIEGEFEDNLKAYLESYPEFKKEVTPAKKEDTGVAVGKIANSESGVASILKQRHPELYN